MKPIHDSLIDFVDGAPVSGSLDVRWIHGSPSKRRNSDPKIQVHAYDAHTFILRQSKTTSFEAPFLFLLFGNERALLLDTGAIADPELFPLRETVDTILAQWLAQHPRPDYELVVAHTHGHGDHVAADGQFADRPATRVVTRDADAVRAFFGFDAWAQETVRFDLGGRILEVIGSPGHHAAAITVYDPWTGFLLTGDTVLPGRLYVRDFAAFTATLGTLVEFAQSRPVTHVLGCHIEMTRRPGRDFPFGATYQPDEVPLQMTVVQLTAIRDAAESVASRPGVHKFDDFIIFNGPCTSALPKLFARALTNRLRLSLAALNRRNRQGR
ncbi:MBL fold metallo-hydrolase [Actinacidiphila oryziradicis]|uniref:MBL fold metallo-hydrolase n=1 Tax=Actinacidiphila oryziradicis TaxID=2571141 RepID=UPI001FE6DDE4|nr:MBL fold metallo-hydrolase [Actinacidiphila oryziradicis]